MKKYVRTEVHFIHNSGGAPGSTLAYMPDGEFREYLDRCHYEEQKKKYKISADYMMRKVGGEYAIIPVGMETTFSNAVMAPNRSAAFIWSEFKKPETVENVVIKSALEFQGDIDKIRGDVHRFVGESLKFRILEEAEES